MAAAKLRASLIWAHRFNKERVLAAVRIGGSNSAVGKEPRALAAERLLGEVLALLGMMRRNGPGRDRGALEAGPRGRCPVRHPNSRTVPGIGSCRSTRGVATVKRYAPSLGRGWGPSGGNNVPGMMSGTDRLLAGTDGCRRSTRCGLR